MPYLMVEKSGVNVGKIIKFPKKPPDSAAIRCKEFSDAVDKCVVWALKNKISIIEIAAILANRVGEVIRHAEPHEKLKLKDACKSLIDKKAEPK